MQYEESYVTDTPEGLTISLPLAGPAQRMAAYALDYLIIGAITFLTYFLVGLIASSASLSVTQVAGAVTLIWIFLLNFGYFILFEVFWNGTTPGKRVVGLRVVDLTGGQIGFRRSLVRNLMRLVDSIVLYAVGLVSMLVSKRNQRLGDMAAGTLVVRQRPQAVPPGAAAWAGGPIPGGPRGGAGSWGPGGPGGPVGAGGPGGGAGASAGAGRWGPGTPAPGTGGGWPPPAGAAPWPGAPAGPAVGGRRHGWDVTAVTSDDVAVIRQYLYRRDQLPWEARQALANDLAHRLWPKVAGAPVGIPAEQFLEQITIEKLSGG